MGMFEVAYEFEDLTDFIRKRAAMKKDGDNLRQLLQYMKAGP